MSRTIPEAIALVKHVMQSVYDSILAEARRYAAENPDDVMGVSYKYDLAYEFLQCVDYAKAAEEEVLEAGESLDDAALCRLIASVAATDVGAGEIEVVVYDAVFNLMQAHDADLWDARLDALRALTVS